MDNYRGYEGPSRTTFNDERPGAGLAFPSIVERVGLVPTFEDSET